MRRIYTCIVIIFFILVSCFAGWLLCDIAPNETYTWYSGIWHGLFFFQNLILSWFTDTLYKAEYYTTAYNVFWWFFTVISCFCRVPITIRFCVEAISFWKEITEDDY